MRPSLKRGVPGSVPPWRAPCFSWPCRGFGLPGVFFRGAAMVFYFQPLELVAEPLGCCQSRFSLGSSFQLGLRLIKLMAAKVNSCSFFQVETRCSGRRQGQETHRPAARGLLRFPNRSVFLRFAQSRRRPLRRGACSVEKASLSSVQLSAFGFPLKLYCKALLSRHLPLSEPIARTAVAAGKLLLVTARCCSRLAWLPPRAPNSVFFSTSRRRLVAAGPW